MYRLVEVIYRLLSQPWVADWREYTLDDDEFEQLQERLKE